MRLVETPEDMKKFEALEKTDDGLKNYENLDSENLSQLGTKGEEDEKIDLNKSGSLGMSQKDLNLSVKGLNRTM